MVVIIPTHDTGKEDDAIWCLIITAKISVKRRHHHHQSPQPPRTQSIQTQHKQSINQGNTAKQASSSTPQQPIKKINDKNMEDKTRPVKKNSQKSLKNFSRHDRGPGVTLSLGALYAEAVRA